MTLQGFFSQIQQELGRFHEDFVQNIEAHSDPPHEASATVHFFTERYRYQVVAIQRGHEPGYLGCQVSERKPRPGEHHLRGLDLSDGPLSEATWQAIKNDIIAHEIVPLYRPPELQVSPLVVAEEAAP